MFFSFLKLIAFKKHFWKWLKMNVKEVTYIHIQWKLHWTIKACNFLAPDAQNCFPQKCARRFSNFLTSHQIFFPATEHSVFLFILLHSHFSSLRRPPKKVPSAIFTVRKVHVSHSHPFPTIVKIITTPRAPPAAEPPPALVSQIFPRGPLLVSAEVAPEKHGPYSAYPRW